MGKYQPPTFGQSPTTTTPDPWKIYKDNVGYWYGVNETDNSYKFWYDKDKTLTSPPGYAATGLDVTYTDITDVTNPKKWVDMNEAGITALKTGAGTTYPEWTYNEPPSEEKIQPLGTSTALLPTDKGTIDKTLRTPSTDPYYKDLREGLQQDEIPPDEFLTDLDKTYKRNMLLYGLGIPMQLRALLQGTPTIGQIPYTHYRSAQSVSGVGPGMNALNQQLGTVYGIGASMGKYGNAGLMLMPGTTANALSAGIAGRQEIDTAELARINAQETANTTALNATAEGKTAAELQRMTLQGTTNKEVQAERTAAAGHIQDILALMANQGTAKIDTQNLHEYYKKLANDRIAESLGLPYS